MKTYKLKIDGMHCASCSSLAQNTLQKIEGVKEAAVNLATGTGEVSAEDFVTIEALTAAISGIGFTATEQKEEEPLVFDTHDFSIKNTVIALIFGFLVMYIGMSHMIPIPIPSFLDANKNPLFFALSQLILSIPVIIAGRSFFINGFKMLVKLHPNMDSLVAVGGTAAILYSLYNTVIIALGNPHGAHSLYYESAAVVLALVLLGKFLEERSKNSAKDAISSLASLIPQNTVIIKDGEKVTVNTSELCTGDIILCSAGEKISVDGTVVSGEGEVDESMLTGESIPVFKTENSTVSGGTVLRDGMLKIRADKVGANTKAAQIAKLVADAQSKKAPIARIADKIASVFVPAVIAIAILSAIIWAILGKDASFVLKIFVSVLVVACPCAMGLATPIAVMVASGTGAKGGILFRGGDVIEKMSEVDAAVFDKTGTITEGKLSISYINPMEGVSENELITYTLCAEHGSLHPVAAGVSAYALAHDIKAEIPQKVISYAGKGVVAQTENDQIAAGTKRLMDELGIDISNAKAENKGSASVYVAKNGVCIGVIGFSDTIRKNSAEAINALKARGVYTVMITGDNKTAADTVANQVGMENVLSEVLPEDKANEVSRLKDSGKTVAMIGDGINDAPALSAADVGVCVFGGTDIAAEIAGILLMREDLMLFEESHKLSKFTMRIIRENLFWAFIYNIIGIPVAAGLFSSFGLLLSPAIAGLMMALSSVCVVTNSLRIKRFKF